MMIHQLESRFLTIAYCDAAEPWQLGFQDAATPIMQGIIDLHHDIFFFLILILVFVFIAFSTKRFLVFMNHGQRSRAALSGDARLTTEASSSTAGGGKDDKKKKKEKEKDNPRKKCQRKGAVWLTRYFAKYMQVDPKLMDPESAYWLAFSDSVLQNTFDYHHGDSAALKSLLDLINSQSGTRGFWPADASSHDLYHAIRRLDPARLMNKK